MNYLLSALLLFVCLAAQGKSDVLSIITRVNTAWQQSHAAEATPFWHVAAYHTGNMEAARLTGNTAWLDYSRRWAEHNKWQGAAERDRTKWLYNYGETPQHVLFADWQICFQTYADLAAIDGNDSHVRRAREVMEYEMSTPQKDYWWWADGLYMGMPVMTKLYRLTGNTRYLDKLYEYLLTSDDIMLDRETGLYYRDAKYVYPKHRSTGGKKDFWARGDGWVLAALAKVLQDVPATWRHRQFIVDKYRRLADAVVACQQPEGYWTRSMLDAQHAPGPETSGTAFFCYGLQWGVNNGVLTDAKYQASADRAWQYLVGTALQRDGSVGYVQPIGERAIPGQTVDRNSTADFGVGAFLLAACERYRHEQGQSVSSKDRAYWVDFATRLATPVLKPMAEGRLQQTMKLEVSPTWDGRNKRVAYMECFGRLMAGLAPWLALPDDGTAEGKQRQQLRQWALAAYRNAVDPDSPDQLLWHGEGQLMVDAAYVAESFTRAYDALWVPLDSVTKQRYIAAFQGVRAIDPPYTNWLLFSSTIESFLARAGAKADTYRVNSAVRKVEEWYVGDGWYADGPSFAFDYYSSYVFHPMLIETLENMDASGYRNRLDYGAYRDRAVRRAQRFSIILERFIAPDGTFPVFGRSIPYRLAAMQPLAMMAWRHQLPAGLTAAQVRGALTAAMHRMYDHHSPFGPEGYLTIGFTGSQTNIADWYTNNGSLYMTSLSLLPLGLPATDPFWTDAPQPWTQCRAWDAQPFPKDHRWGDTPAPHDRY